MNNEKGGSKMDTVVKMVLILFVSLLSFSVGTFVGRQFTESEMKQAALDAGDFKGARGTASVDDGESGSEEDVEAMAEELVKAEHEAASAKGKSHVAVSEKATEGDKKAEAHSTVKTDAKEILKEEKASVTNTTKEGYQKFSKAKPSAEYQEKVEAKKTALEAYKKTLNTENQAKVQSTGVGSGVVAMGPIPKAAQRVAEGKSPTDKKEESRNPTSVLPTVASSSIGKYTVQVASYASEEEAKSHAANLETKGFSAFYIPATVNNKTWYRVSVGLFTSQDSAMNYRKVLMQQANISSAIVQKIIK